MRVRVASLWKAMKATCLRPSLDSTGMVTKPWVIGSHSLPSGEGHIHGASLWGGPVNREVWNLNMEQHHWRTSLQQPSRHSNHRQCWKKTWSTCIEVHYINNKYENHNSGRGWLKNTNWKRSTGTGMFVLRQTCYIILSSCFSHDDQNLVKKFETNTTARE